jgi:hypothetical protein
MEHQQYRSLFKHRYLVTECDGNDSSVLETVSLRHEEIDNYLRRQLGPQVDIDDSSEEVVGTVCTSPPEAESLGYDTTYETLTLNFYRAHETCTPSAVSRIMRYRLDEQFELLAYSQARIRWCQTTRPEYTESALHQTTEFLSATKELLTLSYTMMHTLSWFPRWEIKDLDMWLEQFQFDLLAGGAELRERFVFQIQEVTSATVQCASNSGIDGTSTSAQSETSGKVG